MKSQKERMIELLKSFEKNTEVYNTSENKNQIDESKLGREFSRLKKLSNQNNNDYFKESFYQINNSYPQPGMTVNSIVQSDIQLSKVGPLGQDPQVKNLVSTELQPSEALEVAIRRTLKSGKPINNIDFYDEVNWHLNSLGFTSRLAIDIKSAILEMVNGKD